MTTGKKDEERAARLKAALRDNLKRRKVQARGRAEEAEDSDHAGGAAPPEAPRAPDPTS